jgi:hypothetical protein
MLTPMMFHSAANLMRGEEEQGHILIERAEWLNPDDWNKFIISQDGNRIRLILLDAKVPGNGAFTRLIEGIKKAGLVPVVCEPLGRLTEWCRKHGYRPRKIGKGEHRHEVWYPRRTK